MVILDSVIDGARYLAPEQRGLYMCAVIDYMETGEEPDLDGLLMALFVSVRPALDASRRRAAGGRKGKPTRSADKPDAKPETSGGEPDDKREESSAKATAKPGESSGKAALNEQEQEEEEEKDLKTIDGNATKGARRDEIPYAAIVSRLNERAGTTYRPTGSKTRSLIRARWAEGFREPDFEAVVDGMCAEWGRDPAMAKYLRPETLFGSKFESYLPQNRPSGRGVSAHGSTRFAVLG